MTPSDLLRWTASLGALIDAGDRGLADLVDGLAEVLVPAPQWWGEAACRGRPELFHLAQGRSAIAARAVCRRCVVAEECLAEALAEPRAIDGVRAGLPRRQVIVLRGRIERGECPEDLLAEALTELRAGGA